MKVFGIVHKNGLFIQAASGIEDKDQLPC